MKKTIAFAAAVAFAIVAAPTAQADEQGYINTLDQNQVGFINGPAQAIAGGYRVCEDLGKGRTPDEVAIAIDNASILDNRESWVVVNAAQAQLCPPPAG